MPRTKNLKKLAPKRKKIVDKAMTESEEILKNLHDRASLNRMKLLKPKSAEKIGAWSWFVEK